MTRVFDTNVLISVMQGGAQLGEGLVPYVVCQEFFDVMMFKARTTIKGKTGKFTMQDFRMSAAAVLRGFERITSGGTVVEKDGEPRYVMQTAAKYGLDFADAYLLTQYGDKVITEDKRLRSFLDCGGLAAKLNTVVNSMFNDSDIHACSRVLYLEHVYDEEALQRKLPELVQRVMAYDGE